MACSNWVIWQPANHRFGAWDAPLDQSIQQIRDVYVNQFDDDPEWWFYCWLNPTEKGLKAAEAIEASRDSAQGNRHPDALTQ